MNDRENRMRKRSKRNLQIWVAVGAIVLIVLLLFWVDIADILGWGDGAAMINLL